MATVTRRRWRGMGPTGRPAWREAWGFSYVDAGGKQVRKYHSGWSREDAERALAEHRLGLKPEKEPAKSMTLAELVELYLDHKTAMGKKSVHKDVGISETLLRRFGAETPLSEITAQRVAVYQRDRVAQTSRLGRPTSVSTVNRELAILRHMQIGRAHV